MKKDTFQELVKTVVAENPSVTVDKIRRISLNKAASANDLDDGELRSLPDYKQALDDSSILVTSATP